MQIVVKNRESVSSASTFFTPPVNVTGLSLVTIALIAHQVSGTNPDMDVTFQTSDNLQDWKDVGTSPVVSATAADYQVGKIKAVEDSYGQYLRLRIVVAGTSPYFNYSIFLNTFPSS